MTTKILEKAWKSYRMSMVPYDASKRQLETAEQAFYSGATILFYSVMQSLDPGTEATADDLEYMNSLSDEVAKFAAHLDEQGFDGVRH